MQAAGAAYDARATSTSCTNSRDDVPMPLYCHRRKLANGLLLLLLSDDDDNEAVTERINENKKESEVSSSSSSPHEQPHNVHVSPSPFIRWYDQLRSRSTVVLRPTLLTG